ncbi:hypothetical protein [Convivina praedatoris]|uniref:Uncharacterized protein n=1 Tax=Convivina praedatoris TaxID=2880963 RepID=A0ABM9D5M4_9LACO|nr:hypothetical protein [Convivina sp. LMG 32447]CAH1856008.1 hypothetical protein R078138_01239 [Convivina sp. LMG 32447]CAH1856199.1 hypothetical protein R077815_01349 [Convivina sp. LMG 32447]CAH1857153.1 hypothetical protein LMG032447_01460 [Convivina sp. LMG 32447]
MLIDKKRVIKLLDLGDIAGFRIGRTKEYPDGLTLIVKLKRTRRKSQSSE